MNSIGCKIGYVVADLKRVGPTNQTLNIIRYSGAIENCVVITLFDESNDTQIEEYLDLGIDVKCLHLSRKTALINGAQVLKKALAENDVNIVHSWGTFADIISFYACKKANIKHMLTLRNFPVEEMTTRMNYFLGMAVALFDLHILKNCKNVVCCSKSIKKKMEDTYGWTHLSSIQNGVDFNKFSVRQKDTVRNELGVEKDDRIFISTGSMIPRKRIHETAEAFVKANLPSNVKLWFLGDGNLLESLKEKYKSNKNICFLGKQSDVAYFLSAADVFVSSSESEGMPNAVLEAISCKLPVYLSDIPQHLEVLDAVENCGISYKLGNTDELAMLFVNTDDNKILDMSTATENLLSSDLTMENMGRKYERCYQRILQS